MPITRKQFELGVDNELLNWMKRIHSFLAKNKDKAYEHGEIKQHFDLNMNIQTISDYRALPTFNKAIDILQEIHAITSTRIRDSTYYCYLNELPEVPTLESSK